MAQELQLQTEAAATVRTQSNAMDQLQDFMASLDEPAPAAAAAAGAQGERGREQPGSVSQPAPRLEAAPEVQPPLEAEPELQPQPARVSLELFRCSTVINLATS